MCAPARLPPPAYMLPMHAHHCGCPRSGATHTVMHWQQAPTLAMAVVAAGGQIGTQRHGRTRRPAWPQKHPRRRPCCTEQQGWRRRQRRRDHDDDHDDAERGNRIRLQQWRQAQAGERHGGTGRRRQQRQQQQPGQTTAAATAAVRRRLRQTGGEHAWCEGAGVRCWGCQWVATNRRRRRQLTRGHSHRAEPCGCMAGTANGRQWL